MAGCVDSAELTAHIKSETKTETLEVCQSCAQYLNGYFIGLEENTKSLKITRHRPKKLYAMTALETHTPETKKRLVLDLCDYCPSRYPAAVKFVQVFDKFGKASWLEPVNPLAGSDWLATWCENCGPQHQNDLNIRAWKEKKNATKTERESKQNA
jgi:hypothetical protein